MLSVVLVYIPPAHSPRVGVAGALSLLDIRTRALAAGGLTPARYLSMIPVSLNGPRIETRLGVAGAGSGFGPPDDQTTPDGDEGFQTLGSIV
jgi:hypothetical protein